MSRRRDQSIVTSFIKVLASRTKSKRVAAKTSSKRVSIEMSCLDAVKNSLICWSLSTKPRLAPQVWILRVRDQHLKGVASARSIKDSLKEKSCSSSEISSMRCNKNTSQWSKGSKYRVNLITFSTAIAAHQLVCIRCHERAKTVQFACET